MRMFGLGFRIPVPNKYLGFGTSHIFCTTTMVVQVWGKYLVLGYLDP